MEAVWLLKCSETDQVTDSWVSQKCRPNNSNKTKKKKKKNNNNNNNNNKRYE